ncbi:hypothetical protein CYQ88_07865 [Hydrogenovibrio sp. SC-1]|uniref:ArnT family glycosyltransferase n=1 Tax=Hydrogenovibrio sp. SC-1 TaxID=2065820 RepID=UPI000C7E6DB0|nr:glycosyltransferase family 39 protein [Hydrogenovibrio sp. SC-1]PLA74146.1 hypothetical protein CYQ88_07865 [Hydrogenovibrio sp. SC-1]
MHYWRPQTPSAKASFWLVLAISIWHLFLAGQVNLSVDEAHYALYGLKPDWSYFDHPPMVGWLNAIALQFGQSETILRTIPALFFALANIILYRIAIRLFPDFIWIGFWTLALINSAFMFQLLSISMLPDTPLMLASLMVVWQLLNLRDFPAQSRAAFYSALWLGFWLGIAALSKYTAITLVFSLLLILLIERRFDWLKNRGLWLAVMITAAMTTPILWWNLLHDWLSFLYQIHHGSQNTDWQWQRLLNSQLAQMGVYSLLLFIAGIVLMLYCWRPTTNSITQASTRILSSFSLPILILFGWNAGYEMSLPHWTQLAWLLMSPAVVYYCWQHWSKRWLRISVYISSTLTLTLSVLLNSQLATPWMPLAEKNNIVRELHGWPQAVAEAKKMQLSYKVPLFASNWTQASRIAWYAAPQPIYVTDNRFDQFDLWFGNPPASSDGLVIIPGYESRPPTTGRPGHFKQCQALKNLPIVRHQNTVVRYYFYYCQDFQAVQYQGWVTELPIVK